MTLIELLKKAGFKGQALNIAYAVCMGESSGNARALNDNPRTGDLSYGLFQINMMGDMGPDRRAAYGLSSNDDLFDPLVNAKIAYKMSNGGRNWGPWGAYTNGSYRDYLGGSQGATVTNYSTSAAGSTALGASPVTPKIDKYEMAARYGLTLATINANKEIKGLFNKAVAEGWTKDLFIGRLKGTKWWRTTTDSARKYFMLQTGDPATYKQKYNQNAYSLNALAVQVGLGSQLGRGGKPSSILNRMIQYKMRDGWSDARIKAYFGSLVTMHGAQMWGEAGEAYDQIFQLAYLNGQSYSRAWYQSQIRQVLAGKSTVETVASTIRNAAASKYYAFADQIRAGQNVMDLAQPYISSVAQILELSPSGIDLENPHINRAMTSKVAAGQKPGTQYPLWKFEFDLRSDPLWRKTNNAREGMFTVGHQILKDFGFTF